MPFLADVGSTTFALIMALMVTIGLILWQTQRQWRQSWSRSRWLEEPESWRDPPATVSADDLARWEVRMHELARDLQGQLDTKIALVVELITQADHVSRRLEALLAQARGPCPACGENLFTGTGHSVRRPEATPDTSTAVGQEMAEGKPACGGTPPVAAAEASAAFHRGDGVDPSEASGRFARVYQLLSAGMASHEIAAHTGLSFGEVELLRRLLPLRQQEQIAPEPAGISPPE